MGDSLMTQVGGVVFLNAHLEFSKPTLQPYRFTTCFSNTQLCMQGQTSGQDTLFHYFNKDGDGTDNIEVSLFGVGTPALNTNRERLRLRFEQATNSYYVTTQKNGTGVLRALWLGTYNGGKVQIKCNPDGSMDLFEQSVAPETPEFRLSGRNATDSAKRTLIVNIHPTIDNCVLFSNVGKYCFDDNIDIIRSAPALITFSSAVTGDADFRFRLNADGKIQWGGGGGAPDTTLERTGVGLLQITGALGIGVAAGSLKLNVNGTVQVNNEIRFVDGAIRIFRSGNDLRIRTGSSDRFYFKDTGRLGFAETNPSSAIDISPNAGGTDKGFVTLEELSADAADPGASNCALYCKDVGGKTAFFARFDTGAVQQIAIEP